MPTSNKTLQNLLDTFFHPPTLITVTVFGLILMWKMYEIDLKLGPTFVRVNSNQGAIILHWEAGCCDLDW